MLTTEAEIDQMEYHEDKVINGILHYLHQGEWKEYSKECLTEMYLQEQELFENYICRSVDGDR